MTLPPPHVCRRVAQLHALIGSPAAREAETAREKLVKLLTRYGCSWNDLPDILASIRTHGPTTDTTTPPPQGTAGEETTADINVFDLIVRLIEMHVAVSADERIIVALWVLHTWVFNQFPITPRLALLSPVRGCGKTVLLILIEFLTIESFRTDNLTAPVIYHHLRSRPRSTFLIDEGDNQDIWRNDTLRAVFNSGHRRGGNISRYESGRIRQFPTFAPLAVAAIGTLPLPLLHRAMVIDMQRRPANVEIERLDETNPPRIFAVAREMIRKWAVTCSFNSDPLMPPQLRDRAADNWRSLIAIADALGHGEDARAAAIAMCTRRPDEDAAVVLLKDIQSVFDILGANCITSDDLIEKLIELDHGFWIEWRGKDDDRVPGRLTRGELIRLLRPFQIATRTVWPLRRRPGDKSARGYYRAQFEAAWKRYCPTHHADHTTTHSLRIKDLLRS